MESQSYELIVGAGPLNGSRFTVPETGLRLGRSSSCEIAIPDPALSRNHCLFELRDGCVWVTDLASANGTVVNGSELGAEPMRLNQGDVVTVGESELTLGFADAHVPSKVDLGLGGGDEVADDEAQAAEPVKPNFIRIALWAVAGLAVMAAAYMIVGTPPPEDDEVKESVKEEEPLNSGSLMSLSFEKVQASPDGICRLALSYSSDGMLSATVDDVPAANRHLEKSVRLTESKTKRLDKMLADSSLYALAPSYIGTPLRAGELKSLRLKIVRTSGVFATLVENDQEPVPLRDSREQLEAFAKNELGIWGIDKSIDELKTMSVEARRSGDSKWEERDVQHGNIARAIVAYNEAIMLLETVNPKPAGYESLLERQREARAELDRRYREQCFRADKAINLKDWPTALSELRILCDLVPDDRDPRHAEANAKLLDVEARQKEGRK